MTQPIPLLPKRRDRTLSALLTALERGVGERWAVPSLPPPAQRIVVLKSCCLGDTLLATPLLATLRGAYPQAHLIAGVGRWSRPALQNNAHLDGLLDLEGVGVGPFTLAPYLRVVRRLRAGRFDLAVVLDRSPLLTLLPLLAAIPVRAGIDSGGRGVPLNVRVPWHAVEQESRLFLRVAAALGLPDDDRGLHFTPSADDDREAVTLLRAAGVQAGGAFAVVAPGGGRNPGMTLAAKRWPPERAAALADRLHASYGLPIVLVGDRHDRPITTAVRQMMRSPAIDLAGATSFGSLGALLARCALFVGNDSGPTHLAVAVGAPTIAIFGPTDPAVYAHSGPRAIVLRGPSGQATDEVSVAEAVAAARRLLSP